MRYKALHFTKDIIYHVRGEIVTAYCGLEYNPEDMIKMNHPDIPDCKKCIRAMKKEADTKRKFKKITMYHCLICEAGYSNRSHAEGCYDIHGAKKEQKE